MVRLISTIAALVVVATAVVSSTAVVVQPAFAQGSACVSACKADHNQCRVASKGSASCDAQLQSCLQSCLKK
jgi:hypothetical protein